MHWESKVQEHAQQTTLLLQCAFPTGEHAYYAIVPHRNKQHLLETMLNRGAAVDMEKYGTITASGWGTMPAHIAESMIPV